MRNTFWNKILKYNGATVLLGGTREVSISDFEKLIYTGKHLAGILPDSAFRSGNASGADEAFIKGVGEKEGSLIELILPFSNHRKKNIPPDSRLISLGDLSLQELQEIKNIGIKSNPQRANLLKLYQPRSKSILSIKASFLLRDILMVSGLLPRGLKPAAVAMFHVKHQNAKSSGTIFTMNVCTYLGVQIYTQVDYLL